MGFFSKQKLSSAAVLSLHEPSTINVPDHAWHALTHSVFMLAEAVRAVQATIKRMESNMSVQGDALTSAVDALATTVTSIDAEIKDLNAKVAAAAAAGNPVDPQIATQIARIGALSATLNGDLPAVAPAAAAVVAAAPADGSVAGTATTAA